MKTSDTNTYKNIGIWIDHKEAILVSGLENEHAQVKRIESNAESHFRPSGGWKASGTNVAQSVSKEQTANARRMQQYRSFYKEVIAKAGKHANAYIFGPGEAKLELKKEIEKIKSHPVKIIAVEASDRLTENQMIAKVKSFFGAE